MRNGKYKTIELPDPNPVTARSRAAPIRIAAGCGAKVAACDNSRDRGGALSFYQHSERWRAGLR